MTNFFQLLLKKRKIMAGITNTKLEIISKLLVKKRIAKQKSETIADDSLASVLKKRISRKKSDHLSDIYFSWVMLNGSAKMFHDERES